MPTIGLRQKFGAQRLARQPEPSAVMYDHEENEMFTRDGEEGSLAILYQLIVNSLLKRSPTSGRALDLGCGSGQLLCKIARAMPQMQFTGVELSPDMLRVAGQTAEGHGVQNVSFIEGSWFDLDGFEPKSYDLVTWHLALHHCETGDEVIRVLDRMASLVKPDGTVFLVDIVRPKTERLAVQLTDLYSDRWGSWFQQATLASYRAAFTFDELEDILQRCRLEGYDHFEPVFFNFWQIACVSRTVNPRPLVVSTLPKLWQKRDYFMLKRFFGNRL
jgi:ubiquinone/menaquinone biosynthesis C-methylase UbiE